MAENGTPVVNAGGSGVVEREEQHGGHSHRAMTMDAGMVAACEACAASCRECAGVCDACAEKCDHCRSAAEACAAACRACADACDACAAGTLSIEDCIAACEACIASCASCCAICAACPNHYAECMACCTTCGACQAACVSCIQVCTGVVEPAGRSAGPILHRVMDIRAEAEVDGMIPIAISSDTRKVERVDWTTGERFIEVLDHSIAGIDMSYARDGLPFLLNHNGDVQIGLVERVHLGTDRKLRGFVRMGNHPDAAWVEKDMRAGIRKKVSVGYAPSATYEVLSKRGETPEVRLYRGWRPYEVSSVPVPADYDVGVARSAFEGSNARAVSGGLPETSRKAEEKQMEGNGAQAPAAPAVGASATEVRDYDAERKQRNKELGNLAQTASNFGLDGARLLAEAIQQDLTPTQFAEKVHQASVEYASKPLPFGRVSLNDREQKEYSVVGAMREIAESQVRKKPRENRLEFEVSDSIAAELKRQPNGFFIPMSLTTDRTAAAQIRASVTGDIVGTTSLGGVGVQTSVQSLVEILRNSSILRQAGIRSMDGLSGNVLFPRQVTTNTWSWEGENPSTAKALSAATFDSFSMSPKTGYGATAYSKQLLVQASFSVEQFVREDLAAIASLGIDLAGLHGLGSSNEPTGIFNLSGTGSVLFATNGANPTWAKIVEFETTMATNNALQGRCAYISTPGVRGYLKTNLKNTVAGANYLLDSNDSGLNGYPAYFTNQVKSNFTAGTSTTIAHGVVFGNWTEGILATWGDAIDLVVDPYNYVTQGMVQVVESVMVDYGWRHPLSFVVSKSALV